MEDGSKFLWPSYKSWTLSSTYETYTKGQDINTSTNKYLKNIRFGDYIKVLVSKQLSLQATLIYFKGLSQKAVSFEFECYRGSEPYLKPNGYSTPRSQTKFTFTISWTYHQLNRSSFEHNRKIHSYDKR